MPEFKVVSDYKLMGDQPQAVEKIADGILQGKRAQTLAAQLHGEFKEFFPENAVEYFVS